MSERLRGVRLVAGREIRQYARARSMVITTVILVLVALAAVLAPQFIGGDDDEAPLRLGLPAAAATERTALEAVGAAAGRPIAVTITEGAAAESAVRGDRLDLALVATPPAGWRLLSVDAPDATDLAIVQRGLQEARLRDALQDAGAPPPAVGAAFAPVAVGISVLDPDPVDDEDGWVGLIAAIALVLALVMAGMTVAGGVAEEKATRASEVLLAALRPSELLAGKVLGVGFVTLGQILAILTPATLAVLLVGDVSLPDAAPTAVAAGLLWFVVGYALYAVAFGALGALVARQQEIAIVTAPLSYLLWGGYFIAAFGFTAVEETWFRALSLFPPLTPLLMPTRMVTGTVSSAEVAFALVLTLAVAAALVVIGGRVYRAGLSATGPRMTLGSALGRAFGRS